MPSLLDSPDATGNTQEMNASGSQGSVRGDGSRIGEELQSRRQLRRNASRAKREGEASGSTTVVAKPNKVMPKAIIIKKHQTMRDQSSTVWDTLLVKASSPEAESMQTQTQTCAENVLEPLQPAQICDELRFCWLDNTYKGDSRRT